MMDSLQIYSLSEWSSWENQIENIPNCDIYWLPGYMAPFEEHGDGRARLAVYRAHDHVVAYAFFAREIPGAPGLLDIITPYGYGGPLVSPHAPEGIGEAFRKSFSNYCRESHIVSEFIRFHPATNNAAIWAHSLALEFNRHTFAMDVRQGVDILSGLDPKSRNMVRKSERNEVQVTIVPAEAAIPDFTRLYYASMDHNQAAGYYYFPEEFFRQTAQSLQGRAFIALASLGDRIIAASMLLRGNQLLHYHFSGMDREYRNLGVQNRVLYEAALWAQASGLSSFHLGGGVHPEDNLARFKRSMASRECSFFIGRVIHDPTVYEELARGRKREIGMLEPGYFPAYRSPSAS